MVCCASTSSGFVGTRMASIAPATMRSATTVAVQQVGPVLGEDHALRDLADLVSGATDALQPARDRRRRLHLHHEVDGAHVDAELEARGRDDAAQPAGLEVGLDERALLFADGAVVGTGEHGRGSAGDARMRPTASAGGRRTGSSPSGESVGRNPSPAATATGSACRSAQSSLRRAVRRSARRREFAKTIVDRCASTSSRIAASTCGHTEPEPDSVGEVGEVVDRHGDPDVEPLAARRRHDADRPRAREEPCDLLAGPHRGREPDALHRRGRELVEPLERQGEVRAALGAGERVDLVDDDRLDAAQRLAGRRREHEEQRLGRRDEDLGRMRHERPALGRQRVARADADAHLGHLDAVRGRRARDADERGAQVALDVDAERLQRREVDDLRAGGRGIRPGSRAAGRSPRGRRRGSCPTRWARRPVRARRVRSPARPRAARPWAR